MNTATIQFPEHIELETIAALLAGIGAKIRPAKVRAPKAADTGDYRDMPYRRRIPAHAVENAKAAGVDVQYDADGYAYEACIMDGVSVAKAIRKLESAREAYNRRDGRAAKQFPATGATMSTAAYVRAMERAWRHTPAAYNFPQD